MNLSQKIKSEILKNLGCGLSVESLCAKVGITYSDLCKLAQEDVGVFNALKKWYKRYDLLL